MLDFLFHNPMAGAQVMMGSIGWEGEDDYVFFGTGDDDGYTLVRVQLFEGRDVTKPINPKRAQGTKIICHLSGGLFRCPKKDTRVYVICPKGMDNVPGAGVIVATVEKSPTSQFNKDRAVLDFGDDTHVVIKGKSVAIQSPDNEFISVGSPRSGGTSGITFQAKDGSGGVIQVGVVSWFIASGGFAQTIIQMTPTNVECLVKDGAYWKVGAEYFYCTGTACYIRGGANYIGAHPTAANPALWGLTGIAGVASTSVFLSI